jgi:toxoflavin synthase
MSTQYDAIGDAYEQANFMVYRPYVESHTYWELVGDVRGKSVLDVACGDGRYCRQLAAPEGLEKYGREFWKDYLENPHSVFITSEA